MRSLISLFIFFFLISPSVAQEELKRHNMVLESNAANGQISFKIPETYTVNCPTEDGRHWSELKLHSYAHESKIDRCFYVSPDSLVAFNVSFYAISKQSRYNNSFETRDSIMRFVLDSLIKYAVNGEPQILDSEFLSAHNATQGFCIAFDVDPTFYAREVYDRIIHYNIINYKKGGMKISFMFNKKNLADPITKRKIDEEMERVLSGFSFRNRRT